MKYSTRPYRQIFSLRQVSGKMEGLHAPVCCGVQHSSDGKEEPDR